MRGNSVGDTVRSEMRKTGMNGEEYKKGKKVLPGHGAV